MTLTSRTKQLPLTRRAVIMGILNSTPDSFSDGGKFFNHLAAYEHAMQMVHDGAEIIDIGGESTRPGSRGISATEEIQRVIPVIIELRKNWGGWISIDTTKSSVAAAALSAGADIVNDISGLEADPYMPQLCREAECAIVIMHRQGNPATMQHAPSYRNVVAEITDYFHARYKSLTGIGVSPSQVCFDPGIGFGKTVEHNWQIMQNLHQLRIGDCPLLLGASKKSFIGKRIGSQAIADRTWPTVALTAHGRAQGVMIHRVHQVRPNLDALRMIEAIQSAAAEI